MTSSTDRVPYQEPRITNQGVWYEVGAIYMNTGYISQFDALRTIFAGQRELMRKYFEIETGEPSFPIPESDYGEINFATVQARLHELFGFTVRELSEAMQELRWKPWKQKWNGTDEAKFTEEMADALHFFVEMCITAGISADQLFDAYFRAWEKNRGRQNNGYTDATASDVG